MRSAAAEIAGESLFDLFQRGVRRLGEKGTRGHDHAVRTITALCRLLGNKCRLERAGLFRCPQTFESRDRSTRNLFDGRDA